MTPQAKELLQEIHACTIATEALMGSGSDSPSSPCFTVANAQFQQPKGRAGIDGWHAPEPWSGDIERCQLLFVSSNPGFDHRDRYPLLNGRTGASPNPVDFFHRRYSEAAYTTLDLRAVHSDDTSHAVPFWRKIEALAQELMDDERGRLGSGSVALTEVVHCKSMREIGVRQAISTCSERYLARILQLAEKCRVVVVLGKHAESAVRIARQLPVDMAVCKSKLDERFYGMTCHPSFIGRPGAPKKLADRWGSQDIETLRGALTR